MAEPKQILKRNDTTQERFSGGAKNSFEAAGNQHIQFRDILGKCVPPPMTAPQPPTQAVPTSSPKTSMQANGEKRILGRPFVPRLNKPVNLLDLTIAPKKKTSSKQSQPKPRTQERELLSGERVVALGKVKKQARKKPTAMALAVANAPVFNLGRPFIPNEHSSELIMESKGTSEVVKYAITNVVSIADKEQLKNISDLLETLANLQRKPAAQRLFRYVCGLREVLKHCKRKTCTVKLVIFAQNIVETGSTCGPDAELERITEVCKEKKIPVGRAFSRRRLGKILGKPSKISAIAVFDISPVSKIYRSIKGHIEQLEAVQAKPSEEDD